MNLPEGWALSEIGELGEIITGKTPSTKVSENFGGSIPFIKPGDLDHGGHIHLTADTLTELGLKSVPKLPSHSIMVTCIGNLGKIGITTTESATNQQINSVVPCRHLNYKFLYHYLTTLKPWLEQEASATTVAIINKGKFSKAPIKVAPIAEQQQIAAKLDELLTQVDSIKTRLDAIPNILKRFRQSVLSMAMSGRLTDEWRRENNEAQPNFEEFENLLRDKTQLSYGVLKPGDEDPNGVLMIRVMDLGEWGRFTNNNIYKISRELSDQFKRTIVEPGDIVISVMATVGRAAVIPNSLVGANVNRALAVIKVNDSINPNFLLYQIMGPSFQFEFVAKQIGSAQKRINLSDLRKFRVWLPTISEQLEIVKRVEQLFAYTDQIEQRVKEAQARVNHLTQAILAKAFRGELTADWRVQNPDLISGENSAEALLQRVQIERESHSVTKTRKKSMD